METQDMTDTLIYVYCLSDSMLSAAATEGTNSIKLLRAGDYWAVIKHVPAFEFSEENFKTNVSNIQWLEANARDHVAVIARYMENHTVIPFRFGTIYQDEAGLAKFISDYKGSLAENFNFIRGMEEWSVKIYCNRQELGEKIDELSPEAASLEQQIMSSSPGKAFLLGRKKTELVEHELDRLCKKFGQDFYNEFKELSKDTRLNNLLPKEFTGRTDTMILNATFLVGIDKVSEIRETVQKINEKDEHSGFFIEGTGPWPPFSFISIKEQQ
jgi:hypothetical protein